MISGPRVGHPAKEGLRRGFRSCPKLRVKPRVGHPAKEGLRQLINKLNVS